MVSSSEISSVYSICTYAAGVAGNLFACVLIASPIPTFRRIVRNQSTESFSGLPYIYTLLNCLICFWYGFPCVTSGVILVAIVNSIGAVVQLTYTIIFIIYAPNVTKLKMSGLLIAVFAIFAIIVFVSLDFFSSTTHITRRTFVGYLSIASLIAMFASPLFIINLVIRTKSVVFMPFYLSLSTLLMSLSFFAYGMLLHDFFIYFPQGIGTILGVIQLALYAYYRNSQKKNNRLPLLTGN